MKCDVTDPGQTGEQEEKGLDDQAHRAPTLALTGFIVFHGFLLKILEYVQPELLFQAVTVVSEKALQTISIGKHKSVKPGLSFFFLKRKRTLAIDEQGNS